MPIFQSKKTPHEAVKLLRDSILLLDKPPASKKIEKIHEDILKCLSILKTNLFSQVDCEFANESTTVICKEIVDNRIIELFITNIRKVDFEARKEFVLVYASLLKKKFPAGAMFVIYMMDHLELVDYLVSIYTVSELTLNVGMLLRETIKYKPMCHWLLTSENFDKFFQLMDHNSFDVSSDAYLTFKEMLSRHKEVASTYLEQYFDRFFNSYDKLLLSENYVTKRQTAKLLGEILVERQNYEILLKYIKSAENLKIIMTLMKDPSISVQVEAFHIFKIFVVNPNRSASVTNILVRNKTLLMSYLSKFHPDKSDDEQFSDEKEYVMRQIMEMEEVPEEK